jgi:hypothetical protein
MTKYILICVAALALAGGAASAQSANGCIGSVGDGGKTCPPPGDGSGNAPNGSANATPGYQTQNPYRPTNPNPSQYSTNPAVQTPSQGPAPVDNSNTTTTTTNSQNLPQ